jgi:hypothetical protein
MILKGVHGGVTVKRGAHTILARRIEPGTFVSGTSIAYPVNAFAQHPSQGTRYSVSAWLRYPGGVARLNTDVTFDRRDAAIQARYGTATASHRGTAWWKFVGVAGVILYSLFTTALLVRRGRRRPLSAPGAGS